MNLIINISINKYINYNIYLSVIILMYILDIYMKKKEIYYLYYLTISIILRITYF